MHTCPYLWGPPTAFALLSSCCSLQTNKTASLCSNIEHDSRPHSDNFNTPQLSRFLFLFPIPIPTLLSLSHTHTIVPHQCYILLKRVSEAERPITLTQRVSKKTREKYGGRVKSNRHFSDFNCKCLIAQIIMSNRTRPRWSRMHHIAITHHCRCWI